MVTLHNEYVRLQNPFWNQFINWESGQCMTATDNEDGYRGLKAASCMTYPDEKEAKDTYPFNDPKWQKCIAEDKFSAMDCTWKACNDVNSISDDRDTDWGTSCSFGCWDPLYHCSKSHPGPDDFMCNAKFIACTISSCTKGLVTFNSTCRTTFTKEVSEYTNQIWAQTWPLMQMQVSTPSGAVSCLTTLIPEGDEHGPQNYDDCIGTGTCYLNIADCPDERTVNSDWAMTAIVKDGAPDPSWAYVKLEASLTKAGPSGPKDGYCLTQVGSDITVKHCEESTSQQWRQFHPQ